MGKGLISGAKLTAIADAIRSKTGGTAALTPDAMAAAVAGISTGTPVAAGTFTPANKNLKSYPITVSGLGFTPSRVVIWQTYGTPATNNSEVRRSLIIRDSANTSTRGCLMITANNDTGEYVTDDYQGAKYYPLTLSDGGFTLSATDTSHEALANKNYPYYYIAIG